MIMKLNSGSFKAIDVYKTHFEKKLITFGINETVLTHKADHDKHQCLDYIFELIISEVDELKKV